MPVISEIEKSSSKLGHCLNDKPGWFSLRTVTDCYIRMWHIGTISRELSSLIVRLARSLFSVFKLVWHISFGTNCTH